jgi:hypothetical protein
MIYGGLHFKWMMHVCSYRETHNAPGTSRVDLCQSAFETPVEHSVVAQLPQVRRLGASLAVTVI